MIKLLKVEFSICDLNNTAEFTIDREFVLNKKDDINIWMKEMNYGCSLAIREVFREFVKEEESN